MNSTPSFSNHREQIVQFTDATITSILNHLTQAGDNVPSNHFDEQVFDSLLGLLQPFVDRYDVEPTAIAYQFAGRGLDRILKACHADAQRYLVQDPALESIEEVFYASNGYWATVAYRIANALFRLGTPIVPRTISGIAHSRTGVDIHPGATIAPGLFIDHGTGIAIGCTAVIRENVSLYNGVVLGTRSKPKKKTDAESGAICKRHPTIGRGVSLFTSCFVGGDVEIGDDSTVGAFAFICEDVPAGSTVLGNSEGRVLASRSPDPKRAGIPNEPKADANSKPVNLVATGGLSDTRVYVARR